MRKRLPRILITGASGFVGSNFLLAAQEHFTIFALARRQPADRRLLAHPNVQWIYADIANEYALESALKEIKDTGGVEFVVHLAGFYDFNFDENPEYFRTNVIGTENILREATEMNVRRFIFASSLAAHAFELEEKIYTEHDPVTADFAYARTKRQGEELVQDFSKQFSCSVVRLAAVFSDWCEYGPLFMFLKTWLSGDWKSRVLGGKGSSSITYVHINCLIALFLSIIRRDKVLPAFDTYIASSEDSITHTELYELSTKYYYGRSRRSLKLPKTMATLGVYLQDYLGRIIGEDPFEKPWMMRYVDKQLRINNSYTRQELKWEPTRRFRMQRRLMYMIEHMKNYPYEWQNRNNKALKKHMVHSHAIIYEVLDNNREVIVAKIIESLRSKNGKNLPSYHNINTKELHKDISTTYQFLSLSVRTKNRMSLLIYAKNLANIRHNQGFKMAEVRDAVLIEGEIIREELAKIPELAGHEADLYDEVTLSFELMADEVEGAFEYIERKADKLFTLDN
jgi:nucleoside-diphosphate-sugar epimerase